MHILITRCIHLGFLDSLFIVKFEEKNGFIYVCALYVRDAHINLQF